MNKIINFFKRYWPLILGLILSFAIFTNDVLFGFLGTVIYVPALAFLGILTAILLRNIFNSNTTDKYVDEKGYNKDFHDLPPREKVWLTTLQFWVYLIFAGMIIMAAVK